MGKIARAFPPITWFVSEETPSLVKQDPKQRKRIQDAWKSFFRLFEHPNLPPHSFQNQWLPSVEWGGPNLREELNRRNGGVFTMDMVTFGMLILDDVYKYPPKEEPDVSGVLGGGGLYAMLGARLFREPPLARHIGGLIHAGSDFPQEAKQEIQSWDTGVMFKETPGRLTTRGKNVYAENGHRDFQFLTPKSQINPRILPENFWTSKTYHLICTPMRCMELVEGILDMRNKVDDPDIRMKIAEKKPIFVWEPMEDSCKTTERATFYAALGYVDVFSPNLEEFCQLFAIGTGKPPNKSLEEMEIIIEHFCKECHGYFSNKPSAVIVRLGENGCWVSQKVRSVHVPAYHQPLKNPKKKGKAKMKKTIVDPTGAGNAFMGGLCMALVETSHPDGLTEFETGAIWGSVAASFVVEQIGMPKQSFGTIKGTGTVELWNGHEVRARVDELQSRAALKELSEAELDQASFYLKGVTKAWNGTDVRIVTRKTDIPGRLKRTERYLFHLVWSIIIGILVWLYGRFLNICIRENWIRKLLRALVADVVGIHRLNMKILVFCISCAQYFLIGTLGLVRGLEQ